MAKHLPMTASQKSYFIEYFEVPACWSVETAQFTFNEVRDGTHDSPKKVNTGIPLVTSKNLKSSGIDFSTVSYISQSDHDEISKRSRVKTNDILFSMIGTIGNVALVGNESEFSIKNVGLFRKNSDLIFPKYAYYWLLSETYQMYLGSKKRGGNQKFVSLGILRDSPVVLAPLNEQIRIANKLDSILAKVDKAQARLDKIPAILKRFRQSVLAAATSGELTKEWRELNAELVVDRDKIRIERELIFQKKGKPVKEALPMSGSLEKELYDIPDNWGWFRAEEFCDLITKGTTPKKDKMDISFSVPYIKVYNLTFDGSLDFSIEPTYVDRRTHESDLKRSIVYPGDVLMNIVGPPLGKVSIVPDSYPEWNMNQAIAVFRPVVSVNNRYLSLCLQSSRLLDVVKLRAKATAGQFNLTLEICRDYPIPLAPEQEQIEIVRQVDRLLNTANKVEKQYLDAKSRLDRLTQSILAKAFRGELVTQDPNDEPAEKLLERILEEKELNKPKKTTRKRTTKAKTAEKE